MHPSGHMHTHIRIDTSTHVSVSSSNTRRFFERAEAYVLEDTVTGTDTADDWRRLAAGDSSLHR